MEEFLKALEEQTPGRPAEARQIYKGLAERLDDWGLTTARIPDTKGSLLPKKQEIRVVEGWGIRYTKPTRRVLIPEQTVQHLANNPRLTARIVEGSSPSTPNLGIAEKRLPRLQAALRKFTTKE